MKRRTFLASTAAAAAAHGQSTAALLDAESFRHYIEDFHRTFKEEVVNYIPDARAWEFLKANIPLFTCPDGEIERLYYYRWWTYRKHIKETPAGFLVTEFLKPVKHAAEYNALSCALGHHIAEGRWLHDRRFVDGDIHFWLRTGEGGGIRKNLHQFSGWVAAALYDRWMMDGRAGVAGLLSRPAAGRLCRLGAGAADGKRPVLAARCFRRHGKLRSAAGARCRTSGRASTATCTATPRRSPPSRGLAGRQAVAARISRQGRRGSKLIEQRLWNRAGGFFETRVESGEFAPVREEIGYTPWYFDLPDANAGYEIAWKQLMDPQGFYAPYGPTTAERRSPDFQVPYEGDDCQWNGPSWPFATTITLKALANVLTGYRQTAVSRRDYFDTFRIYTRSQHLKLEDGRVVPFIDEDLNPLTGEWLARAMKIRKKTYYGRGDHYNHSGYADLVITGLAGLRPRADSTVEVNPLLPAGTWDWFCVDRIPYRGRTLAIVWDRDGGKFGKGKGLRLLANGREIGHAAELTRVVGQLP